MLATLSLNSILLSLACLLFIKTFLTYMNKNKSKKLPPSPPALPLIGHLYLLKKPLHHTLSRVAQKYGPITFLHFGSRPVLVISSFSLAEQCFTTHDLAFSNRVHFPSGKHVTFDYNHLGVANYGPHWRSVRQIAVSEVLSPQQLHANSDVRVGEVYHLAHRLFKSWKASTGSNYFKKVSLKAKFFELSMNIMMIMIAGKRFYGDDIDDLEETKRFIEGVVEFFALSGASNIEDFLPVLSLLGATGASKKMKQLAELNEKMTQKLIKEHRGECDEKNKKTMIAKLLELQKENPEKYHDRIIQIIAVSLWQAGIDTSSNTAEWAMTLLLNNQDVLKKATKEIDEQVGNERLIQESDMANLPFLNCIFQEVLRLYPAGPLLVPHESREQVSIGGYEIPSGTMLLVNAYHIHRDPSVWDEPTKFKPERFQGEKAKQKIPMIPFGMGRRRCPGEGLAVREVKLILGTLIQCFDWKRVGDELVDMTEGSGLSLPKAVALEALYRPRPVMTKLLLTV